MAKRKKRAKESKLKIATPSYFRNPEPIEVKPDVQQEYTEIYMDKPSHRNTTVRIGQISVIEPKKNEIWAIGTKQISGFDSKIHITEQPTIDDVSHLFTQIFFKKLIENGSING